MRLVSTMLLTLLTANLVAQDQVQIDSVTHGIITEKLTESRDFYRDHLGFEVVFENEWYIHMAAGNESRFQIAFMKPNHPTQPPVFQPAFAGKGLFYTLEVPDVRALYQKITAAGVPLQYDLKDEPWGERHFAIVDPNGVALNISQPLEKIEEAYKDGFKKNDG